MIVIVFYSNNDIVHEKVKSLVNFLQFHLFGQILLGPMTEQVKSAIKTWEQKILRKIYGPVKDQNGWRIRNNDELQVMYRKTNIVTK
jgi:hypothetical protein